MTKPTEQLINEMTPEEIVDFFAAELKKENEKEIAEAIERTREEDLKIVMDSYHGVNNPQVRAGIAKAAKSLRLRDKHLKEKSSLSKETPNK